MLNLLRKELRLAVHPTSWLFLGLSLMLLIPSYPYYTMWLFSTRAWASSLPAFLPERIRIFPICSCSRCLNTMSFGHVL